MYGFTNRATCDLPSWASDLSNYYWRVRVEGRDSSKRRRFYRYIKKERLRLVESGINKDLVNRACKYLVSLKEVNSIRYIQQSKTEVMQLELPFF